MQILTPAENLRDLRISDINHCPNHETVCMALVDGVTGRSLTLIMSTEEMGRIMRSAPDFIVAAGVANDRFDEQVRKTASTLFPRLINKDDT